MLDNVETTWRGVQDLTIDINKDNEEDLYGLAISSVSLGLFCCNLKNVNKDSSITPEKFLAMRKKAEEKLRAEQEKLERQQPRRVDQPFAQEHYRQDNYSPNANYQNQPINYPPVNMINQNPNPNFQQMQPGPNQYQPYPNAGYQNPYIISL